MSNIEKLLAVISIAQRAYGRLLFRRLLPCIIIIFGLVIVISVMISAVLVGGAYASYMALLNYGMEPQMAMITIGISAVLTIVILAALMLVSLRRLRQMPKEMIKESQLTSCVMGVLGSFLDGLTKNKKH